MFGSSVPPPLPGMDLNHPPDFAKIAEMMQKAGLPPPPPPMGGQMPMQMPMQMPPPPPGFLPPPPGFGNGFPPGIPSFSGIPGMGGNAVVEIRDSQPPPTEAPGAGAGAGSVRRRGPLPSQAESLQMEQRKGKYTRAR